MIARRLLLVGALAAAAGPGWLAHAAPPSVRPRVIVSTDAGGTDYDDLQSLVHLLLCGDSVEIEGLVSSPYGPGRAADIRAVIDVYEEDYPRLARHSSGYPPPAALRAVTAQGATASAGPAGFGDATDGSRLIVAAARRDDPRPLWVLVWGGIDDLAQALHDAPEILPRLRVYFIGGPNKKWSPTAYDYLVRAHSDLWIIEANSTYRGQFVGGDQSGPWGNERFVSEQVAGRGSLGAYFATGITFRGERETQLKMGDTPAVGYLLHGLPDDPEHGGWGGRFVRAWDRSRHVWTGLPVPDDAVETFRVVELVLPASVDCPAGARATLQLDNQPCPGSRLADGAWHFWFCPKESKTWTFTITGDDPGLNGQTGRFRSVPPSASRAGEPAERFPHWWTDDPDPAVAEGPHQGAKTVSRWRRAFLTDFARRLERLTSGRASP
jgi:hypothetical protein